MNGTGQGRILTFYSYKGGTGRSMALANVAWILASNGKRVLAVDWDLEAPGLHRYFQPFLLDKDLTSSLGIIDLIWDFAVAATAGSSGSMGPCWHEYYADIKRYVTAIRWDFVFPGQLDLIPSGQQGPTYATRVNSLDWQIFYDRLGGGVFLESVKERMRREYDYILIDSRTGVSDTSGICTVQMPDDLVVCFTANNQSIDGAAAVTASVRSQWDADKQGERLRRRIFPVFMRADNSEKDKLDAAKRLAWSLFGPYLDQFRETTQRIEYQGSAVVPYIPWFAFEEVLATFRDKPEERNSLLDAFQRLTGYLSEGSVTRVAPPPEADCERVLSECRRGAEAAGSAIPEDPRPAVETGGHLSASARNAAHPIQRYELSALRQLHQLPPPPADFTGRTADLAELRAVVESGGVTISGVRGMGGIGKTALALKLSQELAPLYPDAQIYLDLRGVSTHPVPPAQAMAHVIRTFNPDTRLPESEAEIAALYRSALHGRRALLLMDNAGGADQVRPLIPPEGCLLLVTSRFFFHLPGFQVKDLDEMPPEDARALLLRIAPRIGDQADRIAEVCAGVPLALRQAAGTLAERPDLSPASYASRLASGKVRLGLIEASLSLSYDLLPEELACRWRILSVFPAGFDAPAAATVWELEPEPAETALGELVRRSLVEGDDGRYRLHDLTRVFADSDCGEEERTGAQRRHAKHYRNVLKQADDLYLQGGPDLLRGLRLVDLEWVNIRAGQAWAADHAASDREITELACGYTDAGIYCLDLRLPPTEWIRWLEISLNAARQLGNRNWEGSALGNLGRAYADLGEISRAIELYEQYLAIAREIGDRRGEGTATGSLGRAYADLGETRRAIELHEQHLAIAREIGDRRGEGNATGNLGNAYADFGETRRAIELYEKHLAIAREIGDRHGEESATGNLGLAYANLGELRRAIELYEQVLAIAREIGDRRGEATTCWNLGLAFGELGEMGRAAEMMQICVDYEREIGHQNAEEHAAYVAALRARIGTG